MACRHLNRRPSRELGGECDPSSTAAGAVERCSAIAEKEATHRVSPAWIQIEEDWLIQGEIDEDEFGPMLCAGDSEWLLFESQKSAGLQARRFMAQLAKADPEGFAELVGGEEALVEWAVGIPSGPGTAQVTSLKKYLDLWLTDYSSLYSADGAGYAIEDYPIDLAERIGFCPGVAFRRV